jgi:hypothetical protein
LEISEELRYLGTSFKEKTTDNIDEEIDEVYIEKNRPFKKYISYDNQNELVAY